MKKLHAIIVCLLLTAFAASTMAKKKQIPQMYMFGFSASFKDSLVFFTNVQEVKNVWYDTKDKFLLGRENYSSQLNNHLASEQALVNRTSIVIFDRKKKKVEKKFAKMKQQYTTKAKGKFDVRYLKDEDFRFQMVELNFDDEQAKVKKEKKKEKKKENKLESKTKKEKTKRQEKGQK